MSIIGTLLLCVCHAGAISDIGITRLLYASNSDLAPHSAVIVTESGMANANNTESSITNAQLRHRVILDMNPALALFSQQLAITLSHSKTMQVYSADSLLKVWQKKQPGLLTVLENESSIIAAEGEVADNLRESTKPQTAATMQHQVKPMVHKYLLIGWIQSIKAEEKRQDIFNTHKVSLLCDIDVEVQYKIVDVTTQHVVGEFVAHGHGGVARILATRKTPLQYDIRASVNDALGSLADNILHNLEVLQQQKILP